jgi:hypothetical protein
MTEWRAEQNSNFRDPFGPNGFQAGDRLFPVITPKYV